jgi:hypothetical protein
MYELVRNTDYFELVGEYATLEEAKDAMQMFQFENPETYYTIYKITRELVV